VIAGTERALVGAVVAAGSCPDWLALEPFELPEHEALREVLLGLGTWDDVSLIEHVVASGRAHEVGGVEYLVELTGGAPLAMPGYLRAWRRLRDRHRAQQHARALLEREAPCDVPLFATSLPDGSTGWLVVHPPYAIRVVGGLVTVRYDGVDYPLTGTVEQVLTGLRIPHRVAILRRMGVGV